MIFQSTDAKTITESPLYTQQKGESIEELAKQLDGTPDTFQQLFGLSDQTIEYFYLSGRRYYESSRFSDAGDVFYTISFLNPFNFNVWLSLGLSEMQNHHYDKALEAFAMATLVNMTSVVPHIHSAECYIQLKNYPLAKATLELAQRTMREHPTKETQQFEEYINHLNFKTSNK